jgi:hypothetical protein
MTDNRMLPPPGGPASPRTSDTQPGPQPGRALLAAVFVLAGSAVVGLAGGLIWAAIAPRVQYQVYTLKPPTAYATNPETSAFIAADGWYCFIALAGGALIGLLAYLFAIRRFGALPMASAVAGSIVAALIAQWLGHEASGGPGFNRLLSTSKPGTYLYAPISLGSHGALAFWPLAAAAVAGGIELVAVMRVRHQVPAGGVAMPGMDSFSTGQYPVSRPDSGQPGQPGPGDRPWRPDSGLSGSSGQAGPG